MVDREKIEEEIRQVAYEIYIKSGCIPGRDLDNWLEAERIVMLKYGLIREKKEPQPKEVKGEKPKRRTKTIKKKTTTIKKSKGKTRGKKK